MGELYLGIEKKAKGKAKNHGVETLTWQDFVKG